MQKLFAVFISSLPIAHVDGQDKEPAIFTPGSQMVHLDMVQQ